MKIKEFIGAKLLFYFSHIFNVPTLSLDRTLEVLGDF